MLIIGIVSNLILFIPVTAAPLDGVVTPNEKNFDTTISLATTEPMPDKTLLEEEQDFIDKLRAKYKLISRVVVIDTAAELEDVLNNHDMYKANRTRFTLYFIRKNIDFNGNHAFPSYRLKISFSGILASMGKEIRGLTEPLFYEIASYSGPTVIKGITFVDANIKKNFYSYGTSISGIGILAFSAFSFRRQRIVLEDIQIKNSSVSHPGNYDNKSAGGLIGNIKPEAVIIMNNITVDNVSVSNIPLINTSSINDDEGIGGVIGKIGKKSQVVATNIKLNKVKTRGIINSGGFIGLIDSEADFLAYQVSATKISISRLTGYASYVGYSCIIGDLWGKASIESLSLSKCIGRERLSAFSRKEKVNYRRGTIMGGVVGSISGDDPKLVVRNSTISDIHFKAKNPHNINDINSSYDTNFGCFVGKDSIHYHTPHQGSVDIDNLNIRNCFLSVDTLGSPDTDKPNSVGALFGKRNKEGVTLNVKDLSVTNLRFEVAGQTAFSPLGYE
ncbi:hypothetical protein ACH42_05790 [Endozoicomonas sp. (ex Bugula neritina AB1)]|nr:hypothetical protein ACH42_05790 [Endozoicomonas sp. (ex Bugula neritina AB1)]